MKVEKFLLAIFGGIFFEWKIFGKEYLWKTFGGKLFVDKKQVNNFVGGNSLWKIFSGLSF